MGDELRLVSWQEIPGGRLRDTTDIQLARRRRAQEKTMNSFPQFMTKVPVQIEGKEYIHDIHFMALFSKKKDAVPLIMLHGWPGPSLLPLD
jgi:hypothetical protein